MGGWVGESLDVGMYVFWGLVSMDLCVWVGGWV